MHILIAPDSFKESLSARCGKSHSKGIKKSTAKCDFDLMPIGDGGEGTLETLLMVCT